MVRFRFARNGKKKEMRPEQVAEVLGNAVGTKVSVTPNWRARGFAFSTVALLLMVACFGWEFQQRRKSVEGGVEFQHYVKFMSFKLPPHRREFVSEAEFSASLLKKAGIPIGPASKVYSVRNGELIEDPSQTGLSEGFRRSAKARIIPRSHTE